MNFNVTLTVTKSTSAATEVSTVLKIARGTITRIGVYFPASADDTVHVRAEYHGHQIFPENRGGYYRGDDILIPVEDEIPILAHPYEITIYAYNTASGSDVAVDFMVTVNPEIGAGGSP